MRAASVSRALLRAPRATPLLVSSQEFGPPVVFAHLRWHRTVGPSFDGSSCGGGARPLAEAEAAALRKGATKAAGATAWGTTTSGDANAAAATTGRTDAERGGEGSSTGVGEGGGGSNRGVTGKLRDALGILREHGKLRWCRLNISSTPC